MKEKTDKLITFVGLGVAILCFVLAVLFAMSNGSEVKTLADVQKGGLIDTIYWILAALVIISIVAIVIFLCVKLVQRRDPRPDGEIQSHRRYIQTHRRCLHPGLHPRDRCRRLHRLRRSR